MKIYTSVVPETEDVGIADNDIDGFLKNLLGSVNRECAQNSNDESETRPVKMRFDLVDVPVSELPDVDKFRDIVGRCFEDASTAESKKGMEFFSNAKKVLSKDDVKILLISDEGTRGAGGKFEKGNKFYTLVVSKGRTDKDNVYSAGSFGIGKNAAFAGSELRCVFYASNYSESGEYYCMGKSVLTSWRNETGKNMSHKIFFGGESDKLIPETSSKKSPDWLNKDERGLRLAIVAPRIELKEGWTHGYIASLLSNFFVAINDEHLQFSLNENKVVLNKNTALGYFMNKDVRKAAESSGELERLELAKHCIEAFTAKEFISEKLSINNLGEFEVLIKVAEELPKKVCFIRNGMYITDTLSHFGKPLVRFPNTKDFIVIVRPRKIDEASSEAIKRMENPEHSELTTSYIANEGEVKQLKEAMIKLEKGVRELIKKHAKMEVTSTCVIEELREYFPESGDDEKPSEESNELDPTLIITNKNGSKIYSTKKAQASEGKKGSKSRRVVKKTKKKVINRTGSNNGNNKFISTYCHSLRTTDPSVWRVKFLSLPKSGFLELWPEEESRSGKDAKSIKIESCSAPGASIANGKFSVKIPLTESTPNSFALSLCRDVSVIDMRPVFKEE